MDEQMRVERPDESGNLEDEHDPPGENQGEQAVFSARQVAAAFGVDEERVLDAFAGEFGLDADGAVDSRKAQHLAEVIIGDRPQDEQEAALMELGAYTPRRDTLEPSVWEKPAGTEDDTLLSPDSVRRSDRAENVD